MSIRRDSFSCFGYFLPILLLSLIGMPVVAQISALIASPLFNVSAVWGFIAAAVVFAAVSAVIWTWVARRKDLPDSAFIRYAPIALSFCFYMLLFVIIFGLSGYEFGGNRWDILLFTSFPWLAVNFILLFGGDLSLYPLIQALAYGISFLCLSIACAARKNRSEDRVRALPLAAAAAILCGVCGFQFFDRSQSILKRDYSVLSISDEINLFDYEPFREGNLLNVPSSSPSLSIGSDYPRIDGATAAFPVYAAMAQAIYRGLDEETVSDYVSCSKTSSAYERLINGEIDIFFGAQPSQQQIEAAQLRGLEFMLYPIAKEAFVFFVNAENPVSALTSGQIQDIYMKKITNWKETGGKDEKILPFQRPQNSGSQTIMQKIMGDNTLPGPLKEEYASGMGGVISAVASYRNYTGSIGYSFRFFATGMKPNDSIKLLAIDGLEPSVQNIRNDAYPFTVEVYAVTTSAPQGNTKALIDWIVSPEGQEMVELCGYVGI